MTGTSAIQHEGETASNAWRRRAAAVEPQSLRTYTPSQLVIQRSSGCYHWTGEGRKLVDFTSGVLVANLGHHPREWWRRVQDYLGLPGGSSEDSGDADFALAAPLTAYNAVTPLEVMASERLLENLRGQEGGRHMEQVLWAASGSEAIQKALWCVMRRTPGRDLVLATRYGFHGKKGLAGAVTGSEDDRDRDDRVRFVSFPSEACRDIDLREQELNLQLFQQELQDCARQFGSRLCAVITEPYLGGGGSYHPQPAYLQMLQSFCREHDLLFMLDEIQSCFGRTGPMYAFTRYGLEPDVVCLGKGMGNGVPVSAAVGSAAALDVLNYGECSDTWSANPLSSAAVLATLDLFESGDVLQQGQALSQVLETGLRQLKDTGLVAHIRGEGCVWGVECRGVAGYSAKEVAESCVVACYLGDDQGRAIHLLGPLAGHVLRVSPPLVLDVDSAAQYLQVMATIFTEVAARLQAAPLNAS